MAAPQAAAKDVTYKTAASPEVLLKFAPFAQLVVAKAASLRDRVPQRAWSFHARFAVSSSCQFEPHVCHIYVSLRPLSTAAMSQAKNLLVSHRLLTLAILHSHKKRPLLLKTGMDDDLVAMQAPLVSGAGEGGPNYVIHHACNCRLLVSTLPCP